MISLRNLAYTLGAAFAVASTSAALAQPQPSPSSQPVRLVVAFPAGGPADTIARTLSPHLSQAWHRPVIVENKPGVGGAIAAAFVLHQPPDGSTLLFTSTTHFQAIGLKVRLTYDPIKDFAPITKIGNGPLVLAVRADGPANLKGLLDAARNRPMSFASFGPASTGHIYGAIFNKAAGVTITNVPYLGGGPAVTALLGGHADASFIEVTQALPLLKSGSVRALAIIGSKRHTQLPDVPARLQELGLEFVGNTAAQWGLTFADEGRQWTSLIERAGITAE
jgi:tripartite-type tricarboxylate transporter receptor subunit TctC